MDEHFSAHVSGQLKTYVYRLIDPRNGETFYVGKGKGNRVFAHAAGQTNETGDEDLQDSKIKRIREILNAGFPVGHVIHRHGLDDAAAFEVEAALMDAYPGITNIQGGHGSVARGVMHAKEIVRLYEAKEADFAHNLILINVNRSTDAGRDLYEAVRYAWKISIPRARKAEYVLAIRQGLIIGAYIAEEWLKATKENFPGLPAREGRVGFSGREAPAEIKARYLHKRVPDSLRKQGASNPIKYVPPS